MLDEEALLDRFIEHQSRAMQLHCVFAFGLAFLGVLLLCVAYFMPNQTENTILNKALLSISGTFVSSLCTFPVKELLNRKEKADLLRFLKSHVASMHAVTQDEQDDHARIQEMLWGTLNKVLER